MKVQTLTLSMPTKMITVKTVKALVRLDTSDEFVVNEVIKGNTYRKLNIKSSDIVLDVGLNIGMFTIYALLKKAIVHAFEPERENYELARYNIELNGFFDDYALYNLAVIGNADPIRTLAVNVKRNKGLHSLIDKRGRDHVEVACANINKAIEKIRPTVIKMDIEGGEYECIKAIQDYSSIREFILEFHHSHLNDIKTREKYREITGILKEHFETVEYKEDTKGAWVSIIYCKKGIEQ